MNPLILSPNPADALVAGLVIGAVLMLAGIGVMWLVRSLWSERQATKAERIIGLPADPHPAPDAPVSEFDAEVSQSLAIAAHTDRFARRLAAVGDVIPISATGPVPAQRDGGS